MAGSREGEEDLHEDVNGLLELLQRAQPGVDALGAAAGARCRDDTAELRGKRHVQSDEPVLLLNTQEAHAGDHLPHRAQRRPIPPASRISVRRGGLRRRRLASVPSAAVATPASRVDGGFAQVPIEEDGVGKPQARSAAKRD